MKRFKGLPVLATGDHYKDFKIIRALQEEVENCVKEFNVMRDRAVKAEAKGEAMSETPTAKELLTELDHKHWHPGPINDLASRVEAVVALAEESRRKAVAGDGYGLLHAHEVLALLDGVKP